MLAVQTASMVPVFAPGDALWVKSNEGQLHVGQVVSFRSRLDPRQIVSHRIVAVDVTNQTLVTKGDNLAEPDPAIRDWDVLGTVEYVIPYGGTMLNFLFSWPGLIAMIYLPTIVLLFVEVRRLCTVNRVSVYCARNYSN